MLLFIALSICLIINSAWILSKKRNERKASILFFRVMSFNMLLLLAGFRGLMVGTDTTMYVRCFNNIQGLADIKLYMWRFEPLYCLYMSLIAQIYHNAHMLLFVSALLIQFLFYWICKKHSQIPWYSILMFVFLMFYYNSMSMMRQYIAMMLIGVAFHWLAEKKYAKYVLFTAAAVGFHASAAITLIVLPLTKLKYTNSKRRWYILGAFFGILMFNNLLPILINFFPRYASYLSSDYYQENQIGIVLKSFIWLAIFIIIDIGYHKLTPLEKEVTWNKIEYICALVALAITICSLNGAMLERMSYYFSYLCCISVPNFLSRMKNRKIKYQWAGLIIIGCITYNIVIFAFRPYWSGVIPYIFWG